MDIELNLYPTYDRKQKLISDMICHTDKLDKLNHIIIIILGG